MFAKFFSIYFFLGSLIPGTNFSDLTHLPDLIDHFQLHVTEAAAVGETYSFVRFLDDHFINPDHHARDGHSREHQDLPLHSFSSALLFMPNFDFIIFEKVADTPPLQQFYIAPDAPGSIKGIFQPPI